MKKKPAVSIRRTNVKSMRDSSSWLAKGLFAKYGGEAFTSSRGWMKLLRTMKALRDAGVTQKSIEKSVCDIKHKLEMTRATPWLLPEEPKERLDWKLRHVCFDVASIFLPALLNLDVGFFQGALHEVRLSKNPQRLIDNDPTRAAIMRYYRVIECDGVGFSVGDAISRNGTKIIPHTVREVKKAIRYTGKDNVLRRIIADLGLPIKRVRSNKITRHS